MRQPPRFWPISGANRNRMSVPDRQELVARLLARKGLGRDGADAIRPRPKGAPVRMSLAQRRLWFVDQLDPSSRAYHLAQTLRLSGRVDAGELEASLRAIVERHEVLR